jgi:predicted ATPase
MERGVDPHQWTEILRLEAELLLLRSQNEHAAGEAMLRSAIEIAERQKARLSGLNASVSLARLLGRTGRGDQGRALLEPRLSWFQEGLDTPPVRDARALLDAL